MIKILSALVLVVLLFFSKECSGKTCQINQPGAFQFRLTHADSIQQSAVVVSHLNQIIDSYISDSWQILISPVKMSRKGWLKTSGVLLTTGLIYTFDEKLMAGSRRNWQNPVYKSATWTGKTFEPLGQIEKMNPWCVGAFAMGYVFKLPRVQMASIQIIESLSIASGFRQLIVAAAGRSRPSENKGSNFFKFAEGQSFPSGHASNAFQVATILAYHVDYWPFTLAIYSLAASVGFRRVDLNLHWPSDIFFGAAYGTAVSHLLLRLHEERRLQIQPVFFQEAGIIGACLIVSVHGVR